jgi:group I intron endonuclease
MNKRSHLHLPVNMGEKVADKVTGYMGYGLALQANLCYNEDRKLLSLDGAVTLSRLVTRTLLRRRATMNTLPPHANNGKFSYPTPPARTSGVYTITNTVNGKQYVGSSQDIQLRWQQHRTHLHTKIHHSPYLQHAWDKYGEEAFVFGIVEEIVPEQCLDCEQCWLDTLQPAYNILPHAKGSRGYHLSDSTIEKLRTKAVGRPSPMEGKHHTEAAKEKIRKTREERQIPPPAKDRVVSDKTRARMRAAKKGKPLSEAARLANMEYLIGHELSPENREKLLQANLGKKHSSERVEKNRLSHLGQPAWNKELKKEKPDCSVEECSRKTHAKGLCKYHYQKQARDRERCDESR